MKQSDQLISFAEDLAVLLNAGSDLDSALALLVNSRSGSSLTQRTTRTSDVSLTSAVSLTSVAAQLRAKVRQGVQLSTAMAEHPTYFDNYFIGMVRSGEASGQLAGALQQLAEQLERDQELKNQINSALVYPMILAVAMAMSLVLVLGVILPKLTSLFDSFGGELSLLALVLLGIGEFMSSWGKAILVVAVIVILLAYLLQDQLRTKERLLALVKRVPFIKRLLIQIDFARFTSTLSSLLASGLAQTDALAIAAQSFQYSDNRSEVDEAIAKIKEGKSLSEAVAPIQGLGDLYAHSVASGERAGQLPAALKVLAKRLEKDFSRRAQRMASMIEPILIIALGLLIGLIIYTVFSAMQSMGDLPL